MTNNTDSTAQQFAFVWKTNNVYGDSNIYSPSFEIMQMQFHLEFHSGWLESSDFRVRLCERDQADPPEPFDLSMYLIIGQHSTLHCTTTVKSHFDIIWKGTKSDLSKIVPNFQEQPLHLIVVYRDSPRREKKGHKSVQTPLYLDPEFKLEKLSVDFAKLLDGEDSSSDVEVVCGDRSWKSHRSLLSCRSDVFKTMLQTDMLEGKTGRIEVRDTEPGLFGQFLQHLYTGKLPNLTVDTAMRLYEIGDKYNVEGLKRQCASFLEENLAHDNACGILSLADRHSDQDLKEIATEYVLEQKIPLQEDIWSNFCDDQPVLALKVLNRFCRLQATGK